MAFFHLRRRYRLVIVFLDQHTNPKQETRPGQYGEAHGVLQRIHTAHTQRQDGQPRHGSCIAYMARRHAAADVDQHEDEYAVHGLRQHPVALHHRWHEPPHGTVKYLHDSDQHRIRRQDASCVQSHGRPYM